MRRVYQLMLWTILIATVLACGLISNPLSGAKNLASTAESMASAIPSGLPDVSKYLNPQGTPVSEWNGIPVMTQATAGQEFSKSTYSYRVSGVAAVGPGYGGAGCHFDPQWHVGEITDGDGRWHAGRPPGPLPASTRPSVG